VLGDFIPGQSDVDVLVVCEDVVDERLAVPVARLAAAAPARADLRLVSRESAAAPTRMPLLEGAFAITPGRPVEVTGRTAERDLVVELSVCREHGRALLGPAPTEVVGRVPDECVDVVGDAVLADWQAIGDDPEHAELTVLTTCRIWRFAEVRRHCSKSVAARWALDQDPSLEVVRQALASRAGAGAHIDPALVAALLASVRARLVR
jgi:hypothetical protein